MNAIGTNMNIGNQFWRKKVAIDYPMLPAEVHSVRRAEAALLYQALEIVVT